MIPLAFLVIFCRYIKYLSIHQDVKFDKEVLVASSKHRLGISQQTRSAVSATSTQPRKELLEKVAKILFIDVLDKFSSIDERNALSSVQIIIDTYDARLTFSRV
jgi:hypothetical protein